MTARPLPPTPAARPLPAPPPPSPSPPLPSPIPSTCKSTLGSALSLKRRPHTRRLQSAPLSDLPPVSEEDESDPAEVDEPQIITKPLRRRRPDPLIPLRSYSSSNMPLILEISDSPLTIQEQFPKSSEPKNFALSPSTLFARRRSETILDFPVPPIRSPPPSTLTRLPSCSLSTPVTPPRNSPTPSFSSTSTDSLSCPLTPNPSDNDDDEDLRDHPAKENEDSLTIEEFAELPNLRFPRSFRRSASVVSLRSFSTAEFDARIEPIYRLMYPRQAPAVPVPMVEPVIQNAQPPSEECFQVPTQNEARSPRHVLSVLDTTHGGSFDVPLVLGSFLSPPSSPCSLNSDDSESDGEGIPISWSDSEADDVPLSAALSSSEDEMSDDEAPSRALDPVYRTGTDCRRTSSNFRVGGVSPQLPPLQQIEPLQLDHDFPDTTSVSSVASSHHSDDTPSVYPMTSPHDCPESPSVYSMASPHDYLEAPSVSSKVFPTKRSYDRPLPRESLVPSDVSSRLSSAPSLYHHRSPSPCYPQTPELRSKFSTSTLASIPDLPTSPSSKQAFFARLTGRTKPSKRERTTSSLTNDRPSLASDSARGSVRKRAHIPASPAPSAFSFSTQPSSSGSSIYSTDSGSGLSDESSASTGLRRPPIPIELFLRG